MKALLRTQHQHDFEYWRPVFSNAPDGSQEITYVFEENLRGSLIPQQRGQFAIVSERQMDIDAEVRDLRDINGEKIFVLNGVEYYLFVTSVDAVFDVFGRVVGWRHNLSRAAAE